jgi:UDP-xylose/UDP-N-acetylglucosamine transporter B4
MLFITVQQLPSFVIWDTSRSWLPRLKPRRVPISQWLVLVTTFASGTLLNNLVFGFNVPLTIQFIFRSAGVYPPPPPVVKVSFTADTAGLLVGLAVSMILGHLFMGKRYTLQQIVPRFPFPFWRLDHSC